MPLREFILSVSQSLRMSGKAVVNVKKTGRPPSNSNFQVQEPNSSHHKILKNKAKRRHKVTLWSN